MGVDSPKPEPSAPARSGGAQTALDMTVEKDRGLVRRAQRDWSGRWKGVDDALKDAIVDGLKTALAESDDIDEIDKRVSARVSIAKTVVAMVGQIQADEHLAHKTDTDGSEKHKVEVVYVNKPKQSHEDRPVATAGLLPVAVGGTAQVPERGGGGELSGASGGD